MGAEQSPSTKSHITPLILIVVSLLLLNVGLRTNLTGEALVSPAIEMPFYENFDNGVPDGVRVLNGSWEGQDGYYVQISTTGYDLATLVPVTIEPDMPYTLSADMKYITGSYGGGLLFNSQNLQLLQESHMVRFNVDAGALYLIFGYFGDAMNFVGQGSVRLELPTDTPDWNNVSVQVMKDSYNILLNDAIVARDMPLVYSGGAFGLISSSSQVVFDNLQADYAVDEEAILATDEFGLVDVADANGSIERYAGDYVSIQDNQWTPFSGEWDVEGDVLQQAEGTGFDHAAGYNQAFAKPMSVQTTITHIDGRGGGILFNMAQADSKNESHIVRFVPEADFLVWGYFDAEGVFFAQGSIPITSPETGVDTLEVSVDESAYGIYLNGETIVEGIPTVYNGDYVGLVTAQSVAEFDNTAVSASSLVETIVDPTVRAAKQDDTVLETNPSQSGNVYNLQAISGEWDFGDVVVQQATESTDYIAGTGVAAEQFAVNVTISLPDDDPEAGAGIVFHMAGRDDVANSQMVRFSQGGSEIFWGSYDSNRAFTGAGSMQLSLDWTQAHQLTIVTRAATYDILIDGESLITGIPLQQSFGWIGLISYRGAITFENFELQLGRA